MSFRRDTITKPIFSWARGVLPAMSDTEREALEAGDVWWDADLFTGNPDWSKLLGLRAGDADRRGAGLPQRSGRRALRHARRVEDQLGMARPAAGGLGLHQARKILRHDHSEGVWRPRLLALRAFGSGAKDLDPLDRGRRHRDGAELARARRAADALRHQGAAGALAAAARRRPRHSLLRPHQPGSRLRRRLDGRHRHHLQGHFRGPRGDRPQAQLAQALHHARPGRDAAGPRLQGLRSRSSRGQPGRARHHRRADPDQSARRRDRPSPSAVDAGVPERPELGPRRLHPARLCHRRQGAAGAGLEDADDGARRRPRHFAAVAVGGRRCLCRAHHRRLCPHPRAVRHLHLQVRGRRGAARAHRRHRLSARRGAAADLRGAQCRRSSRRHLRHHEAARDRADAHRGRRRHGHPWRQGRDRRSAKLSRQSLPRRAGRHHGRGRQHPHPQSHRVRAGRDPRASLSARRDECARRHRSRARARRVRQGVLEACRP